MKYHQHGVDAGVLFNHREPFLDDVALIDLQDAHMGAVTGQPIGRPPRLKPSAVARWRSVLEQREARELQHLLRG